MDLRLLIIALVSFVCPNSGLNDKTETEVMVENQQVLTPQFVYSKIHEWKHEELLIISVENKDRFTSFTYVNDSAFADGLDTFRYDLGALNELPTITFYSNKNSVIGEEVTSVYTIHRFDGEKFYGIDSVVFPLFSNCWKEVDSRDTSVFCIKD
jgi:hypothetical protein